MITFQQFISLLEGKKKDIVRAYLAGRENAAEPQIKDYGTSAPNSPERDDQIRAMMKDSGGGAVRRAQKEKLNQAKKAAKRIMKND
jgi:hypothetical protein